MSKTTSVFLEEHCRIDRARAGGREAVKPGKSDRRLSRNARATVVPLGRFGGRLRCRGLGFGFGETAIDFRVEPEDVAGDG